jgi:hypothetical protein
MVNSSSNVGGFAALQYSGLDAAMQHSKEDLLWARR